MAITAPHRPPGHHQPGQRPRLHGLRVQRRHGRERGVPQPPGRDPEVAQLLPHLPRLRPALHDHHDVLHGGDGAAGAPDGGHLLPRPGAESGEPAALSPFHSCAGT